MVELAAGVLKAGLDVLGLKVWKLIEDLLGREAIPEQVEHIRDADAHSSDARPPAALLRIDGYSIHVRNLEQGRWHCILEFADRGRFPPPVLDARQPGDMHHDPLFPGEAQGCRKRVPVDFVQKHVAGGQLGSVIWQPLPPLGTRRYPAVPSVRGSAIDLP